MLLCCVMLNLTSALGVNTRIWLKAHPAFTGVNVIAGTFVADTQTHYQALVRAWIRLQPKLNAAGWGLISAWSGEGIVLVMSQPGLAGSTPLANITTAAEILNAIISMPGVTPNLQQQAFNTWQAFSLSDSASSQRLLR
jgi:hypothetical protein